jgi:hypothetical protein
MPISGSPEPGAPSLLLTRPTFSRESSEELLATADGPASSSSLSRDEMESSGGAARKSGSLIDPDVVRAFSVPSATRCEDRPSRACWVGYWSVYEDATVDRPPEADREGPGIPELAKIGGWVKASEGLFPARWVKTYRTDGETLGTLASEREGNSQSVKGRGDDFGYRPDWMIDADLVALGRRTESAQRSTAKAGHVPSSRAQRVRRSVMDYDLANLGRWAGPAETSNAGAERVPPSPAESGRRFG